MTALQERVEKCSEAKGSYIESTVASGLGDPWGVAVDAAGNVYIADDINSRALKETPSNDTTPRASLQAVSAARWELRSTTTKMSTLPTPQIIAC
ncbi:hypothetical protein [Acidicapsa acidisoli]|uniref:hypothetical protein n=1 Tax=Acidicapsa acidisoli TaxID=1615681 RepID=UPI0037C1B3F2